LTGEPGGTGVPPPPADGRAQRQDVLNLGERERDALLAWVGENLTLVRRSAFGERILYWSLGIAFGIGLAAHVGGFLLKTWTTTEPWLLMADLLYALGWAMWTGVVVVVFVEIYPETKKRQYQRALDAYEAAGGAQAGARSDQAFNPRAPANGEQGEVDDAEQWYRKAAGAGDTDAMFNLATLLRKQGKERQAEQWFRKAADAGNTRAMANLGVLLAEQGEEDQALQWYRKAADAARRDG
jgi:tetratricopeptide (TPR) repeat protein